VALRERRHKLKSKILCLYRKVSAGKDRVELGKERTHELYVKCRDLGICGQQPYGQRRQDDTIEESLYTESKLKKKVTMCYLSLRRHTMNVLLLTLLEGLHSELVAFQEALVATLDAKRYQTAIDRAWAYVDALEQGCAEVSEVDVCAAALTEATHDFITLTSELQASQKAETTEKGAKLQQATTQKEELLGVCTERLKIIARGRSGSERLVPSRLESVALGATNATSDPNGASSATKTTSEDPIDVSDVKRSDSEDMIGASSDPKTASEDTVGFSSAPKVISGDTIGASSAPKAASEDTVGFSSAPKLISEDTIGASSAPTAVSEDTPGLLTTTTNAFDGTKGVVGSTQGAASYTFLAEPPGLAVPSNNYQSSGDDLQYGEQDFSYSDAPYPELPDVPQIRCVCRSSFFGSYSFELPALAMGEQLDVISPQPIVMEMGVYVTVRRLLSGACGLVPLTCLMPLEALQTEQLAAVRIRGSMAMVEEEFLALSGVTVPAGTMLCLLEELLPVGQSLVTVLWDHTILVAPVGLLRFLD